MRYVRLGKSGLEVSVIAFGTWAFGGEWGAVDADAARRSVHAALDQGITLFDTAQAYGFGDAEELLGAALWEQVPRERVIVATKGGLRVSGDDMLRDSTRHWLRNGLEASLRHLRTDYIDLYQVHWPDEQTPTEETAEALEDFVREGKVRHVGVSNYGPGQMDELGRFGRVETLQPPYHMFRRGIEDEILPYCAAHDIGVLVYSPLAEGLLGGRMSADMQLPDDDWRSSSPDFNGEPFRRNLAVAERLEQIAARRGMSLPQLGVAWTLSHPAVHVAIFGSRQPSHLADTAAAADMELGEQERREIDELLRDAVPMIGPSPEMGKAEPPAEAAA